MKMFKNYMWLILAVASVGTASLYARKDKQWQIDDLISAIRDNKQIDKAYTIQNFDSEGLDAGEKSTKNIFLSDLELLLDLKKNNQITIIDKIENAVMSKDSGVSDYQISKEIFNVFFGKTTDSVQGKKTKFTMFMEYLKQYVIVKKDISVEDTPKTEKSGYIRSALTVAWNAAKTVKSYISYPIFNPVTAAKKMVGWCKNNRAIKWCWENKYKVALATAGLVGAGLKYRNNGLKLEIIESRVDYLAYKLKNLNKIPKASVVCYYSS